MVSVRAASVVSLKFVEEVQTMAGLRLKSDSNPLFPPFQRRISFPWAPNPSLEKGKGDFWTEYSGSYAANFWVMILVHAFSNLMTPISLRIIDCFSCVPLSAYLASSKYQ